MNLLNTIFDYFGATDTTLTEDFTEKTSESDILSQLKKWSTNDININRKILTEGKINYLYYIGQYQRDWNLATNRSGIKDNRIFTNTKSVIPHVTSKPAEPVIYARRTYQDEEKEKRAKRLADLMQEVMKQIYRDCNMQQLNESNSLNRYIYKVGVLKTEIRDGKIYEKIVNPQLLYLDGNAKNIREMRYIGERITDKTAAELIELFPKKKDEITSRVSGELGTKVEIVEWWTKKYKIVTIKDEVILSKEKNPLWDYEREEFNYFKEAPIPYKFLNVYNSGISLIDDTGEIDLTISLQDGINDILRQIVDNAKYNGNPIKVAKSMNAGRLESIIRTIDPGKGVTLGTDEEISYLQAAPLPGYIVQALEIMYREIDNIFGAQQSFRGEYESAQSGTSRQVLRQGSENSLAIHARGLERLMKQTYEQWYHIINIYSNDMYFWNNQMKPILGEELAAELQELILQNRNEGMSVYVEEGSMLPTDKISEKNDAITLAQIGRISTKLLYERIGIPHAEKEALNTLDENAETKARATEIQAKADIEVEQMKNKFQKSAETGKAIEEQINQLGGGQNMENRIQQSNLESMINNLGN